MSIPKFKIGEVVILQSKDFPQYNGSEHVVELIQLDADGPSYDIGFYPGRDEGWSDFWQECALRKKHKGSEFSFESLMENLKKVEQKA